LTTDPCTNKFCEGKTVSKVTSIELDPKYFYHIYTNKISPNDNETASFGVMEFGSTQKVPLFGKNSKM
jgi:hypothetical protein